MSKDLTTATIFTTGQIATICKVVPRTVTKWFDSGRIRGYQIPGSGARRIPREELIKFLKQYNMVDAIRELEHKEDEPLRIAKNATSLLHEQGGEKLINLLGGMMRTCCTRCGIFNTCEFAFDAYNVNCEPKIDCLATK